MKKYLTPILAISVLALSTQVFAIDAKFITLKDGSTLKGNVLELSRGVYTIKTESLGTIKINQDDINSIATERMKAAVKEETAVSIAPVITQANLTEQVERVQSKIMGNPAMMAEIQSLMNDPQIMGVISNPEFMKTLMQLDMDSIQNDPEFRKLLENPKMLELINKIK